jgi:hypothetical protein
LSKFDTEKIKFLTSVTFFLYKLKIVLKSAPKAVLRIITELWSPPYVVLLETYDVQLLDKEIQSAHLSKKYGKVKFVPLLK